MINRSHIPSGHALSLVCAFALPLLAQRDAQGAPVPPPTVQGTAEREIQKRQKVADSYAPEMVAKGADAMASKDYESAFSYYRAAVDALPLGGAATEKVRDQALDGFCDAALSLAKQRVSEGRFADAEEIVPVVLKYAPNNKAALALEKQLKDPSYFNRTNTPKYVAQVEEVKRLLNEADGYYQSGRYDLAFRRYEQVLNVDRYNIAARRGMERVNSARQQYASTAYSQTRGDMMTKVEKAWELPVRRYDLGVSSIIEQPQIEMTGTQLVNDKLNTIIVPKIEFTDTSVPEAIAYIKQRSVALDVNEPDPARRGVNIVLMLDPTTQKVESLPRVSLQLQNAPLGEVLNYVAQAAGLKTKIEAYAVAIVPMDANTEVLLTKEYSVPPSFVNSMPGGGKGSGNSNALATRAGAKEILEGSGVTFPPGASAQFVPNSSKLIVRNTPANLSVIDSLVEIALATPPTQVQIQSKFMEVTQNNLQELGLDWLVGQFAMPFGSGVYGSGGTQGGQPNGSALNYPLGMNNSAGNYQPYGANGVTSVGQNVNVNSGQVTAGNRSGAAAIRANALDGLLFGTPLGPAPGVLALAGVFTNPQFQVVLRAISQKKGLDLLSAPSVTTKSGREAKIEISRKFSYPDTFTPPTVPAVAATGQVNPVTPATPASFKEQDIGVRLSVLPTVGPDGFTIDLVINPQVTEFEGFINYGSPVYVSVSDYTLFAGITWTPAGSRIIELTPNVINQPVFSERSVKTNVTIYDGQTVGLGGLIREDVQSTTDKVPILGDIPLLGRAFRTDTSQHIKKNLLIFVTTNLIDPAGQPLIKQVEDDTILPVPSDKLYLDEIVPTDTATIAPQL